MCFKEPILGSRSPGGLGLRSAVPGHLGIPKDLSSLKSSDFIHLSQTYGCLLDQPCTGPGMVPG